MGFEFVAGIVQRLVCKPSKLEMRVRFPLPAPKNCEKWNLLDFDSGRVRFVHSPLSKSSHILVFDNFYEIGRAPELESRGRL